MKMNLKQDKKEEKLHITFHLVDHSEALEQRIRLKAEKLLKAHSQIINCRIVVESPHHHKHQGNLYQIRMDIKLPGEELVVNKQPGGKNRPHEDPYVAVVDAFNAAEHLLQRYKEKTHDTVKHHALPLHGKIAKLKENYGYIESPNSAEIYFHKHSLAEGIKFKDLKEGDPVHFIVGDEEGKNLSASRVKLIAYHSAIEDMHSIKDLTQKEV
jgi:ribosome-associated translation inhibitor RaiA